MRIKNPDDEIRNILKLVRMEGAAGNKYKKRGFTKPLQNLFKLLTEF